MFYLPNLAAIQSLLLLFWLLALFALQKYCNPCFPVLMYIVASVFFTEDDAKGAM